MTAVLAIIGILVFFIFRSDWRKCVYLLLFMVPFFGFIQIRIQHLTFFAPLIQDITVIIPLYLMFIFHVIQKKGSQFPIRIKNFLYFFIFLVFIYTISPFYEINILARLIGAKVWIFYLLFIFIGFEFLENRRQLKKVCNFLAIMAIFPAIVGIALYLSSYFLDYRETMIIFHQGNAELASAATQGFGKSDWGAGVKLFRINSTFSFPSQFFMFTFFSTIPAISSIYFAETVREKFFFLIIVTIIIIGTYTTGQRGVFMYYSLFFLIFFFIRLKLPMVIFAFIGVFLILQFTVDLTQIPILNALYVNISGLNKWYVEVVYSFPGFGGQVIDNLLGNGVGTKTLQARYAYEGLKFNILQNEGYFYKAVMELGIVGLILIIYMFILIIQEIYLSVNILGKDKNELLFSSFILAYTLYMIVTSIKGTGAIDAYPINFLFWFFFGIVIKLRFLKFDNER